MFRVKRVVDDFLCPHLVSFDLDKLDAVYAGYASLHQDRHFDCSASLSLIDVEETRKQAHAVGIQVT